VWVTYNTEHRISAMGVAALHFLRKNSGKVVCAQYRHIF
jgi:hypothetical protein